MTRNIESRRYAAVRDRAADASFVFAVRTTGIVCRSGCPSRTPAPQNVLFFDDVASAVRAGFRACKRCAPDDTASDARRDRLVAKACALLDDPEGPSVESVAASVGLSRFHFARAFRTALGVTPAAYRRARRDRRFREHLASGESVTRAVVDAGFGSASRAYESQSLGMTPTTFKRGAAGERIAFAIADCTLGRVVVAIAAKGVCAIELGDDDASLVAALHADFSGADIVRDDAALAKTLARVVTTIDRPSQSLELDLDVRGTAFQQRVWRALRDVPAGERVTYAGLASAIGAPGAARAVGAACAANKLAVAIPCHRVTRADGELSGYRWGTERKRRLLDAENSRD